MRINKFHDINVFDNLINNDKIFTIGFTNDLVIKLVNNNIIEIQVSNDPYFDAVKYYISALINKDYFKLDDGTAPKKCIVKKSNTKIQTDRILVQNIIEGQFITCKLYYNKITFFKSNNIFEKIKQSVVKDCENLFLFLPVFSSLEGKFINGKYYIYNIQISQKQIDSRWKFIKSCFDLYQRFFNESKNIILVDLLDKTFEDNDELRYFICTNEGYYN